MYINYGDYNLLDWGGILLDSEHSDTDIDFIYVYPFDDLEDEYFFARGTVCINDDWINAEGVKESIGNSNPTAEEFAIGCIGFYGAYEFSGGEYQTLTREDVCKELKHYLIASDNLNIEW